MSATMKEQLTAEMKACMKAKDKERLQVVRSLLAAIKQVEIDNQITVDDAGVLAILDKAMKQRRDSHQQFTDADRPDLAEQEAYEMTVIQDLQTHRPMVVHMLDKLVVALPEGLFLTKFEQSGVELLIEGLAQSNARVSAFMRNLDESEWFDSPRLEVIQVQEKNGSRSSKFTLKVKQLTPEEIEAKKAGESK